MGSLKQLASHTAIYGIPSIVGKVLNYLLTPLYTFLFLPAEYGVMAKMYAVVAFLNVIFTYGMETAFFRFSGEGKKNNTVYGTALNSLILTSLLLCGLGYTYAPTIAGWLNEPLHPEYVRWFAMILALDAIAAIPFARLRQQNRAFRFAWVRSLNIALNIAFNLFFLVLCPQLLKDGHEWISLIYDTTAGIAYIFIANLLASAITLLLLLPEIKGVRYGIDLRIWQQMLLYAFPLLFAGLAGITNETLDRILLDYLLPPEIAKQQNGIYAACYKLSILMTLFIQAFRFAAEPFFFARAREKNAPQAYARIMNYFVAFCCLIFLLVTMYLDVFKHFLRNPLFFEGLAVVPILLLANLFLGVYFNLSIWYKLANKTIYGAYIAMGGAVITIALNFLLIPVIGFLGSAWTTLLVYFLMAAVSYLWGQKEYPIPYDLRKFMFYILFMLFLYLVSEFISYTATANTTKFVLKSILMLTFIGAIVWIEKPKKMINSQR